MTSNGLKSTSKSLKTPQSDVSRISTCVWRSGYWYSSPPTDISDWAHYMLHFSLAFISPSPQRNLHCVHCLAMWECTSTLQSLHPFPHSLISYYFLWCTIWFVESKFMSWNSNECPPIKRHSMHACFPVYKSRIMQALFCTGIVVCSLI